MDKVKIDFVEQNYKYDVVTVYGSEGIKHYHGYTIEEAKRKYREGTLIFKNHRRTDNAN